MDFFKKNYETVKSLAIIIGAVIYLHNFIDAKMDGINSRLTILEKDVSIMKTILIMQGTIPKEFANQDRRIPSTPVSPVENDASKKTSHS